MKLLLVGNDNALTEALVATVSKAGWEVYLLVGATDAPRKPEKVFVQYCFRYDSENIREVVESVAPDAVLFTGVYDDNYRWATMGKAAMYYAAGLFNLLSICATIPDLRFFYLSSAEVFPATETPWAEDAQPAPDTERGALLAQGEEMCLYQQKLSGLEATVIRLDNPYGVPRDAHDGGGPVGTLCTQALKTGRVTGRAGYTFSSTYVSDVAEGVFRIMAAQKRQSAVYHLSSEDPQDERKIAGWIREGLGGSVVVDDAAPPPVAPRLSCARARAEFGFKCLHSLEDTIPEMCRTMTRAMSKLMTREEKVRSLPVFHLSERMRRVLALALPYAENLLCAALCLWLNAISRESGLANVDFLLLYALLFGSLYGKRQAVVSAFIGVFVTLFLADDLFEQMIQYETYVWIAEVFTVGMLVGHLRDHLDTLNVEKEEEFAYLRDRLRETEEIQEKTESIKRAYETRLIGYTGSMGRIYKITAELNHMDPGDVLFSAAQTVAAIMETKDVSIYQVVSARYCRLFSSTSEKARSMGKSVAYAEVPELLAALKERRVFINKKFDAGLPMMACAIYDGDKPTIVIMVWSLKMENMTLYQANVLTILCQLVMLSLNRANNYLEMLAKERFIEGTRIMEEESFQEMLALYRSARKRGLADFTHVDARGAAQTPAEWNARVESLVRSTDYIGAERLDAEGRMRGVDILLPNSNDAEAAFVIRRLTEAGYVCEIEAEET